MANLRTVEPARILVTGANGFVGRALCAALERSGHAVRAAVRGASDSGPVGRGGVICVGAIDGRTDWTPALDGVQVVVHLAARVHVMRDRVPDPLAAFRAVNVEGSMRLARQAAQRGVKRLVFLSSIKVNGEATAAGHAFSEDDAARPLDNYGHSKWEAEQGLRSLAQATGMDVTIVRPPLVYGPGVRANFAALMRTIEAGWPLPLASVRNRRSLIGIDNLSDLLMTCMHHPAAANQTFLASDGEDLSTPDLLRRLASAMHRPARLLPVPPALLLAGAALLGRRTVVERLCGSLQADSTKARSLLGWVPPIGVDEGLRRIVAGTRP